MREWTLRVLLGGCGAEPLARLRRAPVLRAARRREQRGEEKEALHSEKISAGDIPDVGRVLNPSAARRAAALRRGRVENPSHIRCERRMTKRLSYLFVRTSN